uniref:Uncharacterized protein n=2 Tax=Amphimedon queenslandica TaxID=400682 RepID=A0A1X7SIG8_AMPQE
LASLKELSEIRLQEIKQLKLELEENNYNMYASASDVSTDESFDSDTSIQEAGEVVWSHKGVHFINSSVDQCMEVVNKLENHHKILIFSKSSSENIQFLIPIVLKQGTIKKLVIQSTLLTRDDILSFSSQLSINKSLTFLNLTRDSMRDDGLITLVQSLQHNRTLESLDLSYNPSITSASVPSLAELLLTNSTLSYLDLSHTSIDTDGVMILMESCKTNNTLKKFRLVSNITDSVV